MKQVLLILLISIFLSYCVIYPLEDVVFQKHIFENYLNVEWNIRDEKIVPFLSAICISWSFFFLRFNDLRNLLLSILIMLLLSGLNALIVFFYFSYLLKNIGFEKLCYILNNHKLDFIDFQPYLILIALSNIILLRYFRKKLNSV